MPFIILGTLINSANRTIELGLPKPSELFTVLPVNEEIRVKELNNLISTDQWDFIGDSPISIAGDAEGVWRQEGKAIVNGLSEVLNRSAIISNYGLIALRTAGVIWKKLCDELELLKRDVEDGKWGGKTARRKVLTKYRMTDHIFDSRLDEREALIYFLESHKMELERYIREIANEFQIEIPLKRQKDFFDTFSEEKMK